MRDKKNILLVREDLCKVVEFAQKCVEAGIDETDIFATIDSSDIIRFLNTKAISTVIIDSDLYNLNTASILKQYSQFQNIQILLITDSKAKKTIRMIMDKNLKYLNPGICPSDLAKIIVPFEVPVLKKVAHF